jgi:uncharacterized protein YbbC (DUF1343 family)
MKVHLGIDNLIAMKFRPLRGAKIGLCTNISSCDAHLNPTIATFRREKKVHLKAVFAPEHGLFGALQDQTKADSFYESQSGLVVHSIYKDRLIADDAMEQAIDILVIDLQDIGARYYTFVWSALLLIEQMARLGKKVVVLDRPNPLGGTIIQGPVLSERLISFVGLYPVPVRHGLTIAELCTLACSEMDIDVNMQVITMTGWERTCYFDETGLVWTVPSPNMPCLDTALVYPGMCLLEGTNISEGRGTTRPFELFGAPWIQPEMLVASLRKKKIRGAEFRPTYFIPTFHKYKGERCGGAQIYVTKRAVFNPVTAGLEIIRTMRILYERAFAWRTPPYEFEKKRMPFDILIGNTWIRKAIDERRTVSWMQAQWQSQLRMFRQRRKRHLLYA